MSTLDGSEALGTINVCKSGSKGRFITLTGNGTLLSQSNANNTFHYKLYAYRTSDSSWQYWVDTAISLNNAPGGSGNYNASTLTSEGKY